MARQKATFSVKEKVQFPETTSGNITTNTVIATYVNTMFSKIFSDYHGCRIITDISNGQVNNLHPVKVELIFRNGATDDPSKFKCFEPIVVKQKHDPIKSNGRMNFVSASIGYNQMIKTNKVAQITQDGIDIISQYLYYDISKTLGPEPDQDIFNKKGIVVEAIDNKVSNLTSNQIYPNLVANSGEVFNIVNFVDINKVLQELFEDSDRYQYMVVPIKSIFQASMYGVAGGGDKWLLNIMRINTRQLNDLIAELTTSPVDTSIVTRSF